MEEGLGGGEAGEEEEDEFEGVGAGVVAAEDEDPDVAVDGGGGDWWVVGKGVGGCDEGFCGCELRFLVRG